MVRLHSLHVGLFCVTLWFEAQHPPFGLKSGVLSTIFRATQGLSCPWWSHSPCAPATGGKVEQSMFPGNKTGLKQSIQFTEFRVPRFVWAATEGKSEAKSG